METNTRILIVVMHSASNVASSKEISLAHFFSISRCSSLLIIKQYHLNNHGWMLKNSFERLSNSRYADDILLYAESNTELESMVEALLIELKAIRLDPNAAKTKILTTNEFYMSSASFICIQRIHRCCSIRRNP